MTRILPLFISAALLAGGAGAAAAQEALACGERAVVLGHLAGKYQEQPVAMGMATTGVMVEILASDAGDSFSVVYTMADGTTCLVAAGRNWQSFESRKPEKKI